ncbi:MAG: dihydrodipicolinate synthase family protein, partial [Verrucomicrobiaceae bacterium]|nr:dihydrodipicolinate synthase family protein [Verrucomicrobiaceae bacterium]
DYISVEGARELVDEGLVSWIKYAIVREDTARDPYLARLVEVVDPALIVSGIGEQPVIEHLVRFGVNGFTAGCVCVRPDLSDQLLRAVQANDLDRARDIQALFKPLEDLRNGIHPVRVLHEAVRLADIADTGPALPLLSGITPEQEETVKAAALTLLHAQG